MCSCPDPVSTRRLDITTLPRRRRRIGRYPTQNGPIHSAQAYFRCHGRHEVDELVRMQQERDESFRAFAARVRVKAETCAYTTKCTSTTSLREVDFTDSIIRDVLIAGIADLDIRREVLGRPYECHPREGSK